MNRVRTALSTCILLVIACLVTLDTGRGRLWAQGAPEPPNPFLLIAGPSAGIGFGRVATTIATPLQKSLTLQNGGSLALGTTGITIQGANAADFSLVSSNCGTLAAAGFCTLTVAFKPLGNGSRTAMLSIADNAGGTPHVVPLTGWGVDPTLPQRDVGPIDPRIGFPGTYTAGLTHLDLCPRHSP